MSICIAFKKTLIYYKNSSLIYVNLSRQSNPSFASSSQQSKNISINNSMETHFKNVKPKQPSRPREDAHHSLSSNLSNDAFQTMRHGGTNSFGEKQGLSKLQQEAQQIAYEQLKLQKMKQQQQELKSLDDANYQRISKPSSSQLLPRTLIEKQGVKSIPTLNPQNVAANKHKKMGHGTSAPVSFNSLSSLKQQQETETIFTPTITPVTNSKKPKTPNSLIPNLILFISF